MFTIQFAAFSHHYQKAAGSRNAGKFSSSHLGTGCPGVSDSVSIATIGSGLFRLRSPIAIRLTQSASIAESIHAIVVSGWQDEGVSSSRRRTTSPAGE